MNNVGNDALVVPLPKRNAKTVGARLRPCPKQKKEKYEIKNEKNNNNNNNINNIVDDISILLV